MALTAWATNRLNEINSTQAHMENQGRTTYGGVMPNWLAEKHEALSREYADIEAGKITGPTTSGRRVSDNRVGDGAYAPVQAGGSGVSSGMPVAGKRFSSQFPNSQNADNCGFNNASEWLVAAIGQFKDPRLAATFAASGSEYSNPYGGFSVNPQFSFELLDNTIERSEILKRCRVIGMTSDTWTGPRWDGYDHHLGVLFGGIVSQWTAEGDTQSAQSAPKLEQLTLNAHKLRIGGKTTLELLADSPQYQANLGTVVESSIQFDLEKSVVNGVGVGTPLGYLRDPAKITVSKETGQAAATITYANLAAMFSRMYPGGFARAVWIINQTALPQLLTLSLIIGASGAHVPVLSESNGTYRILGKEVIFTEKAPALGTEGDVALVDLSQFALGMRESVGIEYSPHIGFQTDEVYFRCRVRADGRGVWKTYQTPLNGDTVSWVITLQTRS